MSERALVFGDECEHVGILSRPEGEHRADPNAPAVIFLNAGLLHRIGPNRLYVSLARRLARSGVTSLRFDFSGVGDSGPRSDALPAAESAVREAQGAMTFLGQETGAQTFILIGLCSGADNAFRTAADDRRVVGLVLIDPYPFRTLGFFVRHYGRRLFRVQSWINVFSGRHAIWDRLGLRRADSLALPYRGLADRHFPSRAEATEQLREMMARGIRLCVIYTGGLQEFYNYRHQFKRMFRGVAMGSQVTIEFLENANHTLTLLKHQGAVIEIIATWMATANATIDWGAVDGGPLPTSSKTQLT